MSPCPSISSPHSPTGLLPSPRLAPTRPTLRPPPFPLPASLSHADSTDLQEDALILAQVPDMFLNQKAYAHSVLAQDAYPRFLRAKAFSNLSPFTSFLRLLLGLLFAWAGLVAAFCFIFLDIEPRRLRVTVRPALTVSPRRLTPSDTHILSFASAARPFLHCDPPPPLCPLRARPAPRPPSQPVRDDALQAHCHQGALRPHAPRPAERLARGLDPARDGRDADGLALATGPSALGLAPPSAFVFPLHLPRSLRRPVLPSARPPPFASLSSCRLERLN